MPRATRAVTPSAVIDSRLGTRLRTECAKLGAVADTRSAAARLLAQLATATGATRASLMTVNPFTGRLVLSAVVGLPEELLGRDVAPRPRSISEWVFRHGRGIILNGEVRDQRFESTATDSFIESAMSVPVRGARGSVGVLNLARSAPSPVYTEEEMATLEAMLDPIATALAQVECRDFALRHRAQVERTHPATACHTASLRRFEVVSSIRASGPRGADGWERVSHPEGGHTVLAFDVAGDGAAAAEAAAFVRGLFVGLASPARSAAAIVARLGAELHARHGGRGSVGLWVTQLSGNGEASSCNAGLPPPLWVPADGSDVVRLDRGGPPAGAVPRHPYEEESLRLLPGDLLVMASDGILGTRGNADQPFGAERLIEIVSELRRHPLERIANAVDAALREFGGRPVPSDDEMLLALRYRPGDC